MTYIKKMSMQGFKSFANKTEILLDNGINVIVGPNGSGKSNISDALCFVLGRLSIKSMRAAKAKNLLFMGSKYVKPSKEASVEIVFDNANNTFALPHPEISIKRVVRHNGQSIYKINEETKTRSEVIEMLAHAGIDPHGFNMVLQGQIQAIVKMHPEERRKIIEEVAGIAIYESRKEKSLKELEKTEEKLKEISAVLRERTSFLRNLEKERSQALRYKELETTIKRCKASIITRKIEDKNKELNSVRASIETKSSQKGKIRSDVEQIEKLIETLNEEITKINKHIQKSTGLEQESLHESISNLRAELEGLKVRKENYENRKSEIEHRIEQIQSSLPQLQTEIDELSKESPLVAKKQEELKKKKLDLERLEEEKKKSYALKTEINNVRERLKEKQSALARLDAESDSLLKQIEEYSIELNHKDAMSCEKEITKLRKELEAKNSSLSALADAEISNAKKISSGETQIESADEAKKNVQGIDICPLCQNTMTPEHLNHVITNSDNKISAARKLIDQSRKELEKIREDKESAVKRIKEIESKIDSLEREQVKHNVVMDKQEYLKKLIEEAKTTKTLVQELEAKRDSLDKRSTDSSRIEEQYNTILREIEEISSRTDKDLDTTLLYKQRELERSQEVVKRSKKDLIDIETEISDISEMIESKSETLEKKDAEEKELNERFKKLFKDRDELQEKMQQESYNLSNLQTEIRQIEDQVNYLKVGNAKLDAERESLEMELKDYSGSELIQGSIASLEERLQKSQQAIMQIGSVNQRALEVYDEIKAEYDRVQEKVNTLQKEKEEVLKIIEEIDKKKKRTFMKTFKGINEIFTSNFSQLYSKGTAFLEMENKEDIFSGGVNIAIRLAKGKYFDVTSLSGGEQTLIALSLLFAIQEYKPYHFYIFDEIDAALDKRNSERLSALLKKYIKAGQYVIVTHNDAIITDSTHLYGVSMHDGVSKILSLKLD